MNLDWKDKGAAKDDTGKTGKMGMRTQDTDCSGESVVKNLPSNAGNKGSILSNAGNKGRGAKILHALSATTREATRETSALQQRPSTAKRKKKPKRDDGFDKMCSG